MDLRQIEQRRLRAAHLAGALVVLVCASWALFPLEGGSVVASVVELGAAGETLPDAEERAPFDASAFDIELWNPPPPPAEDPDAIAAAAASARPIKPFRLQLVSITEVGGERTAALYDPGEDELHVVRSGERVDEHTVDRITTVGVDVRTGGTTRHLFLAKEER